MYVRIILGSKHPCDVIKPIYTIHCRYPRFIHAEVMTHRCFSRNARSSRAVPVERMIEEVETNPAFPWYWGANQPGMQAKKECNNLVYINNSQFSRERAWKIARDNALDTARAFMKAGYHKQVVNRLLEPFMWIDTLITSTEWDNFFKLRIDENAEPHIRDLAIRIKEEMRQYPLKKLETNQWHIPYIKDDDHKAGLSTEELLKVSAARCARISYKPFVDEPDYEKDLKLYSKLIESKPMHASPIEHQAKATVNFNQETSNFSNGWEQYRKFVEKDNKYNYTREIYE